MSKRPRVLLVDDDPDVEKFLTSRLAKFGVDTLYAPDGAEGYRVACRESDFEARPYGRTCFISDRAATPASGEPAAGRSTHCRARHKYGTMATCERPLTFRTGCTVN